MILETNGDARPYRDVTLKKYRGTHEAIEGLVEAHNVDLGFLNDCALYAFEQEEEPIPTAGSKDEGFKLMPEASEASDLPQAKDFGEAVAKIVGIKRERRRRISSRTRKRKDMARGRKSKRGRRIKRK